MDLHAGQIQGFFDIPFDNLFSSPVIIEYLKKTRSRRPQGDLVSSSAPTRAASRTRARVSYAKQPRTACVAMIDKRRTAPNVAKAMNIIGDVEGKTVIILDDMIDTAGTLTEAAHAVLDHGATRVFAAATHGVLSGPAIERIKDSQDRARDRDRHDSAFRGRLKMRKDRAALGGGSLGRSDLSYP